MLKLRNETEPRLHNKQDCEELSEFSIIECNCEDKSFSKVDKNYPLKRKIKQ